MSDETNGARMIDYLRTSAKCGALYGALAKAQIAFKPIPRTRINPYYHSKYADLADIIAATQDALSAAGLCVIQGSGTDTSLRVCYVTTRLAHESGQWIEQMVTLPATMRGEGGIERFDAQSVGAAITYGRRYGRSAILGVASEDDDDANAIVAPPREGDAQSRPARSDYLICPRCGKDAIIKGSPKYGGGRVCWKKRDGCGAKWTDEEWETEQRSHAEPSVEAQEAALAADLKPLEPPRGDAKSSPSDPKAQERAARALAAAVSRRDETEARDLFTAGDKATGPRRMRK